MREQFSTKKETIERFWKNE